MEAEKDRKSLDEEFEMEEKKDPELPLLPVSQPDVSDKDADHNAKKRSIHPAFYVAAWISLSSTTILFNKYILSSAGFAYPIILTSWHLSFATITTQILARCTKMLDSRKKVPMNGQVYLRKIMPIGLMFSLSLVCGNLTYLYLSVSFIQMLKATMPVVTLIMGWAFGLTPPSLSQLGNVSIIVVGVMIASFGEIQFVLIGFLYQCGGILFEAIRLVMMQQLLSGADFKMDPLVSLYYFAPVCAIMNGLIALVVEVPRITLAEVQAVGLGTLFANGAVAFALNVSVVFLIGKTSSLVMTLCGVLKDILLVIASMLIFRDPVSGLQAFGYTIALAGLLWYKLGADKLKEHIGRGTRAWAEYGHRRPIQRKLVVFFLVVVAAFVTVVVASTVGAFPTDHDPVRMATDRLKGLLGWGGSYAAKEPPA